VVGCIGRLLGEVSKSGTARTERGRKQLKKTLLLLERSLLERLRAIAGDEAAGAAEALIEQTAESLDTEAATSKYIKDRRAMTQSSEKLRRLIAQTGDDVEQREALRQSLMEQGLSGEDWHELVVSGPGAEPAPEGGAGVSDIRTLTMLLSKLGDAVRQSREAPAGEEKTALNSLAAEVSGQVQALATSAETKIEKLRRILYVPAGEAGPGSKALSRRELVEILAEIGQEFSQPLTVVVAALDTLNEEAAGELTERQKLLLSVAAESGSRLTHLVNCLMRIVGYPKSLSPEQTVLDALYEGAERP
jgi:K+-sensing histidine kinase KdpD